MKCKACGILNDADAAYCKQCGSKLGNSQCSRCGSGIDPDAMFCSKCGTEVTQGHAAKGKPCQSCGFVNNIGTTYCKRCNQKIL